MARFEQSTPGYKKTSTEHFSPLADQHTATAAIPPCITCGSLSDGGMITKMADNYMECEFYCITCKPNDHFAVNSTAIWPNYEVISQLGRGKLRLRRLSRDEALKRFTVR